MRHKVNVGEGHDYFGFPCVLRESFAPTEPVFLLEVIASQEMDGEDEPTIKHNDRLYKALDLLDCLSFEESKEIAYNAPRSLQEFWDAVVRRWPNRADDIVKGSCEIPFKRPDEVYDNSRLLRSLKWLCDHWPARGNFKAK